MPNSPGVLFAQESNGQTSGSAPPTLQQRDTAQYVADMILELRNMSKSQQLFTITVPLEYAYYEAFSVANRVVAPPAEVERLKQLARMSESDHLG